ncbi:MAG: hypothetical protein HS113_19900 [Verrucomicrobiales bacterium]|nr:hypothetical protein [Verrucomicrobiales bacterium]
MPLWWVAGALALFVLCAATGAEYWLAPPGTPPNGSTPTVNSWAQPLPWSTAEVQALIRDNPKAPQDPEVVLHLRTAGLTNVYAIERFALAAADYSSRRLALRAADPPERPVLRYEVPGPGAGLFRGPTWESTLLDFSLELDSFEAHDLVLDANWPAWAATNTCASPAYTLGFTLKALIVRANTGWIQNVHIRHCGANGVAPLPRFRSTQRECFPLWVDIPTFRYGAAAQPAWIIEDCEVSDFHVVRGGYGSAIVVATPNPPGLSGPGWFYTNRVAVVRRCQVRGAGNDIAFATASSAAISFHDNVVVGTALGMNNDTARDGAPLRNIDLTNNIVLDVQLLANVGVPARGAGLGGTYLFTNITVAANAVRLRAVPWRQESSSFEWRFTGAGGYTNWLPVSDPSLPVGRVTPGYAAGMLVGGADQIRFVNNRFTTWPLDQFYEPDPTNTALAIWRPLFRPSHHPVTGQNCYHGPNFQTGTNWLSSASLDFQEPVPLPAVPTAAVSALAAPPTAAPDFIPYGRVMRVRALVDGTGQLRGVEEVQMARPEVLEDGRVRVRGRCVNHPSVLQGGSSSPVVGGAPRLRLRVATLAGASSELGPETVAGEEAIFTYMPLEPDGWEGLTLLLAPAGTDGPLPPVEALEAADIAWTAGEVLRGTTVRFERTADVADDRRRYPGLLRISRTGPTADALPVVLQAVTSGVTRPALPPPALDYDYDLYTNHWAAPEAWYELSPTSDGQWTLVIPPGQSEVTVRVKPTAGSANQDWVEHEAAYFRLVPRGYAVAPPARWVTRGPGGEAAVALWDGPTYRLYRFTDEMLVVCDDGLDAGSSPDSDGTVSIRTRTGTRLSLSAGEAVAPPLEVRWSMTDVDLTPPVTRLPETIQRRISPADAERCRLLPVADAAYALNAATAPAGLRFGGFSRYETASETPGPQPVFDRGGVWPWPELGPMIPFGEPGVDSVVYGVDERGGLAGVLGRQAGYQTPAGEWVALPTANASGPSTAQDIASTGRFIVGFAPTVEEGRDGTRPLQWSGADTSWTVTDLGGFEPLEPGYAYSVNNRGLTVGKTRVTLAGNPAWRAFRTEGVLTPATRGASELRLPQPSNGVSLTDNTAQGTDETGHAVGATDAMAYRLGNWQRETRAVLWWAGESRPTVLGTIMPESWNWSNSPGQSEALAASTAGMRTTIVGTGWTTPTGYPRAWMLTADSGIIRIYSAMINLNDPHQCWLPYDWILVTAEDVNEQGWIVGTALAAGTPRGYVLMPQPTVPANTARGEPPGIVSLAPLPELPPPPEPPPRQVTLAAVPTTRPCAPVPERILVSWLVDPSGTCEVTEDWKRPVDVDQDGVPDFSHERLRTENHWRALQGQGVAFYHQDDEIEALYPEAHVEVYVRVWSQDDALLQDCKLSPGQTIEPTPPLAPRPYWTWNLPEPVRPAFAAEGVGIVSRTTQEWCGPLTCWGGEITGFLKPAGFAQPQEGLFGIRLRRPDGWHLGWLRLRWTWALEDDPPWGRLELLESAVHPEPEKAVQAGQPPRPELSARLEGGQVLVSWGAGWSGFVLERSRHLRPAAWETVGGVNDNRVRLPATDAPAYFRLRQ